MDYEKKYKEALEIAQKLYQDCPNGKNDRLYHTTDLEKMFPELRESEDERIRKELIEFVKSRGGFKQEYIAWLEKQGEQSSLNINRECLKGIKRVQEYQDLSDWEKEFDKIASMYAHNKNQEGYNDSWYVKERAAEMLYYAKKELEKQGGQKPAWSRKDEKIRQTIINEFKQCSEWYCANGLTKEDCINWLNKQEYFEWGDEDNENMNSLCVLLDQMVSINAIGNEHSIEYKNWLKSIKQRMGG